MNRIKISLLALLCVLLYASCSSSDDESNAFPESTQKIVGKWAIYQWMDDNGTFQSIATTGYFAFYESGSFVFSDGVTSLKSGTYKFTSSDTMFLDERNGYDMTEKTTFDDSTHATFTWYYNVTPDATTTIKVEKQ